MALAFEPCTEFTGGPYPGEGQGTAEEKKLYKEYKEDVRKMFKDQTRKAKDSQNRHYDDEKAKQGSEFVERHSGMLQSLEYITEELEGTPPPSTELPPVTGDPLTCCFFQARR